MIKGVIFDLDGTLLNTLADLHNITNKTLEAFGYPPRSMEEVETFVGNGARKLIQRALPEELDLSEEEFEKIIRAHDDAMCGDWKEETAEQYEYALNVLPPMRWTDGGFFVSEAETDNIHAFHQRTNGKYYTSLQRTSTPRRDILESLKTYINNR